MKKRGKTTRKSTLSPKKKFGKEEKEKATSAADCKVTEAEEEDGEGGKLLIADVAAEETVATSCTPQKEEKINVASERNLRRRTRVSKEGLRPPSSNSVLSPNLKETKIPQLPPTPTSDSDSSTITSNGNKSAEKTGTDSRRVTVEKTPRETISSFDLYGDMLEEQQEKCVTELEDRNVRLEQELLETKIQLIDETSKFETTSSKLDSASKENETLKCHLTGLLASANNELNKVKRENNNLLARLSVCPVVTCPTCQLTIRSDHPRPLPKRARLFRGKNAVEIEFGNKDTLNKWLLGIGLDLNTDGLPIRPEDVEKVVRRIQQPHNLALTQSRILHHQNAETSKVVKVDYKTSKSQDNTEKQSTSKDISSSRNIFETLQRQDESLIAQENALVMNEKGPVVSQLIAKNVTDVNNSSESVSTIDSPTTGPEHGLLCAQKMKKFSIPKLRNKEPKNSKEQNNKEQDVCNGHERKQYNAVESSQRRCLTSESGGPVPEKCETPGNMSQLAQKSDDKLCDSQSNVQQLANIQGTKEFETSEQVKNTSGDPRTAASGILKPSLPIQNDNEGHRNRSSEGGKDKMSQRKGSLSVNETRETGREKPVQKNHDKPKSSGSDNSVKCRDGSRNNVRHGRRRSPDRLHGRKSRSASRDRKCDTSKNVTRLARNREKPILLHEGRGRRRSPALRTNERSKEHLSAEPEKLEKSKEVRSRSRSGRDHAAKERKSDTHHKDDERRVENQKSRPPTLPSRSDDHRHRRHRRDGKGVLTEGVEKEKSSQRSIPEKRKPHSQISIPRRHQRNIVRSPNRDDVLRGKYEKQTLSVNEIPIPKSGLRISTDSTTHVKNWDLERTSRMVKTPLDEMRKGRGPRTPSATPPVSAEKCPLQRREVVESSLRLEDSGTGPSLLMKVLFGSDVDEVEDESDGSGHAGLKGTQTQIVQEETQRRNQQGVTPELEPGEYVSPMNTPLRDMENQDFRNLHIHSTPSKSHHPAEDNSPVTLETPPKTPHVVSSEEKLVTEESFTELDRQKATQFLLDRLIPERELSPSTQLPAEHVEDPFYTQQSPFKGTKSHEHQSNDENIIPPADDLLLGNKPEESENKELDVILDAFVHDGLSLAENIPGTENAQQPIPTTFVTQEKEEGLRNEESPAGAEHLDYNEDGLLDYSGAGQIDEDLFTGMMSSTSRETSPEVEDPSPSTDSDAGQIKRGNKTMEQTPPTVPILKRKLQVSRGKQMISMNSPSPKKAKTSGKFAAMIRWSMQKSEEEEEEEEEEDTESDEEEEEGEIRDSPLPTSEDSLESTQSTPSSPQLPTHSSKSQNVMVAGSGAAKMDSETVPKKHIATDPCVPQTPSLSPSVSSFAVPAAGGKLGSESTPAGIQRNVWLTSLAKHNIRLPKTYP